MKDGVVFLTGATGALCPWIAQQALADGMSVRVLARSAVGLSASERVARSFAMANNGAMPAQVEVVEGDICDRQIDPGRVDVIVHCAACTSFNEGQARASRQTNVGGLRRIFDLSRRQKIPLVHVSTAFVCGNRTGRVLESELDIGQQFNNTYERTKCESEAAVHQWSKETGLPATVLRPGIVMGSWSNGRAVRFSTLYHLMKALDEFGPSLGGCRLRLIGASEVTKNVVPVDHFAEVAWWLIRRGASGTYHITHPEPITMRELGGIFAELFNIDLRLVSEQEFGREGATTIERICHRVMMPYRPYMTHLEPRFDRRTTIRALDGEYAAPPRLDLDYFRRLLEYGRQANWGVEPAAVSEPPGTDAIGPLQEYFEVFLAERTHQHLLPDLKRLSARCFISIKDQPGLGWLLDLREGVLKSILRNGTGPECAFAVDSTTFLEIAAGRLPPQRAFFTGRVRITGNIELGLKVATVLGKFFVQFPFVAEAI